MKLDNLDTPSLIVDLNVMEHNLRKMGDYCDRFGLQLRPHTKTHKIPELAKRQQEFGAAGVTVAKIGEAEVMSENGLEDLLLAYPIWGEPKSRRLREVLERSKVTVALDSEHSADWVSKAADGKSIDVLIEIDFGMRRCGVAPGPGAIELARAVDSKPGLSFLGIFFYPGHLHPDFDNSEAAVEKLSSELGRQLELFEKAGIEVRRVSGGSTPSAYYSHHVSHLTEIRPGTYIFNDRNTLEYKACLQKDCAASILVTVVSTSVPGQAIIDGGSKTFSSDLLLGRTGSGYGLIKEHPDIHFAAMNEEHGYLKLPPGLQLEVGQRLQVIPNHICTAVNMHEVAFGYSEDDVLEEWTVKARGKIR